jgi:purine nucleosidase
VADRQGVWVDTDMGFDDLAAILLLQGAGVQLAGLSLVAGNTPLPQVIRNAIAAAETFGWAMPVHAGAAEPLAGPLVTADYVLGADGMPGRGRKLPDPRGAPDPKPAIEAMAAWMRAGGRRLLALGPLTNIAALVEAYPDLGGLMRLVWMGGSAGPGNHTAAAEFNAYVDPEALQAVINAGVTVELVGLDACRQVQVDQADVVWLRSLPGERAALLADLLDGYVCIPDPEGRKPMALYDPVAAAVYADERTMDFAPARLDCELQGRLTRGMTVIEWRARKAAPNARIATRVDATRVRTLFRQGLARAATGE